jgi:hypothetical protein
VLSSNDLFSAIGADDVVFVAAFALFVVVGMLFTYSVSTARLEFVEFAEYSLGLLRQPARKIVHSSSAAVKILPFETDVVLIRNVLSKENASRET